MITHHTYKFSPYFIMTGNLRLGLSLCTVSPITNSTGSLVSIGFEFSATGTLVPQLFWSKRLRTKEFKFQSPPFKTLLITHYH